MKFSITDFFSKCDQIRRKLQIWSHLLNKSLMENLIFLCSVLFDETFYKILQKWKQNDAQSISFYLFFLFGNLFFCFKQFVMESMSIIHLASKHSANGCRVGHLYRARTRFEISIVLLSVIKTNFKRGLVLVV